MHVSKAMLTESQWMACWRLCRGVCHLCRGNSKTIDSDVLNPSSPRVACCIDQSNTFWCLFTITSATDVDMPHCWCNKIIIRFLSPASLSTKNSMTSNRCESILIWCVTSNYSWAWAVPPSYLTAPPLLVVYNAISLTHYPAHPHHRLPISVIVLLLTIFFIPLFFLKLTTNGILTQQTQPFVVNESHFTQYLLVQHTRWAMQIQHDMYLLYRCNAQITVQEAVLTFTWFEMINLPNDFISRNFKI